VAALAVPPVQAASRRSRAVRWVIVLATLLALGLRLYELLRPGYLLGITEYDDGTDFGSAVRLIHGALPYHDFIMVQPPGITLLMAPVALATKAAGTATGMAAARVLTALAGVAAVALAGLLVRHRGLLAVIVACGTLAVYPDSLLAARTVLLEPWLVLFCLLGALAVFTGDTLASDRRMLLGGLAFGFAGAVKVWAILPVLVVLGLTLMLRRRRGAAGYAAGVVLGFGVPVLPFALSAPATFYRSVIVAQLVRSDVARIPQGYRLQQMLGLVHVQTPPTPVSAIIGLAVVAAVAAVSVTASRLAAAGPPPLEVFAMATTVLVVIAFLWPSDFYYHYAAFLAPFLALALALPVSRLLAALPVTEAGQPQPGQPQPGQPRPGLLRRHARLVRGAATAVAAVTFAVLAGLQTASEAQEASQVPAAEITQAGHLIPPGACVATDQVSYTIAINRFVSSVPGCSLMVDGVGTDYALSGHNGLSAAGGTPAVQAAWLSAFRRAQYLWLTSQADKRIPWTPRLLVYLHSHFVPLTEGPDWLYVRMHGR
jgi:Glycosyltransferase family 87